MSTDAGQEPPQQSPPEWYSKPPEWLTRPPVNHLPQTPPPVQGSNNDLVTAINAMPERVVNALTDAINGATQRATQQSSGSSPEQPQVKQQEERQPVGSPTFRDWWLGDGTAGSGGSW